MSNGVTLGSYTVQLAETAARNILNSRTLLDPVEKLRVSNPENLIDTDFEYGLQSAKWESIELVNNIPTFFTRTAGEDSIPVTDVIAQANSLNVKVTTSSAHNFVVGSPIIVVGLKSITAEGSFVVNAVLSTTVFIYKAKEKQKATQSIFDSYTTYLYPGNVYQSTQYTIENIESMETDTGTPSKIVVKTKSPSGFLNGTYFMLANSVGRKEVNFDASLINVVDTFTTSFAVSTSSNVAGGTGYKSKEMIPYDYQSKKTVFFYSSNVDTSTESLTIPGHGLSTGTTVMYVCPSGDTPVGGLSNYELYSAFVVDASTVRLRDVTPTLPGGLDRTILNGYWAENITFLTTGAQQNLSWSSFTTNFNNVDHLGAASRSTYFIGYFRPNENGAWRFRLRSEDASYLWFGDVVRNGTYTTANFLTRVTGVSTALRYSPTNSATATTGTATASLTSGTLYPILIFYGQDASGTNRGLTVEWQPPSQSGGGAATGWINNGTNYFFTEQFLYYRMASGFWNGSLATYNSSAFVTEGFISSYYLPNNFLGATARSASFVGWFVPNETGTWRFRIEAEDRAKLWIGSNALPQNQTDANQLISIAADGGALQGAENTIALTSGVYYPFYFIYGQTGTIGTNGLSFNLLLRKPTDGGTVWRRSWFDYVRFRSGIWGHTTSTANMDLTTAGTSANGPHALMKAYLVNRTFTDQRIQTSMTLTNYLDAALTTVGAPLVAFSRENGVDGFGAHNIVNSQDNISLAKYVKYTLSTAPTVGASSTDLLISGSGPRYNYAHGKTWVVPFQALEEFDSFYSSNHGLAQDSLVTVQLSNGSLPTGLTNNTQYRVESINANYFRLKQNNAQRTAVDLQSFAASTIRFVQSTPNPLANTVYSEGHDFTDGTEVVYDNKGNASIANLTNGGTYYVVSADLNTFGLSNASGLVNFVTVGSGTHTFVSVDRATDGNYKMVTEPSALDPYTFELSTNFTIPFNAITFDPHVCVDLNTNRFRYPTNLNPQHRMRTGARVIYETNGGTAIGGLANETDYYMIAYNLTQFGLAESYSNAINNQHIDITSYGAGKSHVLHIVSVMGEISQDGAVSIHTSSNVIVANTADVDFLSTMRLGDTIKVEVPEAEVSYAISSVNSTNETVTLTANHNLSAGNTVYYRTTGAAIGGLSNNYIYYVSIPAANVIALHDSPEDAQNLVNYVNITGTTFTGSSFYTLSNATMFVSKVRDINSKSVLTVDAFPTASAAFGNLVLNTSLYPRSDGYFLHRPFDGGVEIVPSLNPGASIVRQTRRYFRYQSGKGIQMSEAVNFAGSYEILSLTRTDTLATATTRKSHRLTAGVVVTITGVTQLLPDTDYWNGTYVVFDTPDLETFRFDLSTEYDAATATTVPSVGKVDPDETTAGGYPMYTVRNWTGAKLRVGLFDDQNGIFFEYDGDKLYAVLRNSVTQLPGSVEVEFNRSLVVGTGTKFNTQLTAGDFIVIRGMSYKVAYVEPNSDTRLYVQPPYRGVSGAGVIVSKTIDQRYPRSAWSVDKCDGTGASGYLLDVARIQMVFIDYAWYGAGMVRYGFRLTDGSIVYVHEIVNNNARVESYMRSGNLPGRFEVTTTSAPTYVPALMHWGTSVIMDGRFDDDRAYLFTAAGAAIQYLGAGQTVSFDVRTDNTASSFQSGFFPNRQTFYQYITYSVYDPATGRTVQAFRTFIRIADQPGADNNARAAVLNNVLTYVKSGTVLTGGSGGLTAGTTVVGNLIVNQAISGAGGTGEIIMYIDRKPSYATPTTNFNSIVNVEMANVSVTLSSDFPPSLIPLVSIRLAPSVDNGRPGALGSREVINRMQLTLDSVGILTTHDVEIKLLLNAYPFTKTWERVQPPSLSQLILHKKGDSVSGGVQFYSFRVSGGQTDSSGKRGTNSSTVSLEDLATLGNSIVGGDDIYPNGPDLLTIGATIIDGSSISATSPASITGRITWTESQA